MDDIRINDAMLVNKSLIIPKGEGEVLILLITQSGWKPEKEYIEEKGEEFREALESLLARGLVMQTFINGIRFIKLSQLGVLHSDEEHNPMFG